MPDKTVVRITGLKILGHGVTFSVRNVPTEEVEAVEKIMRALLQHGEQFAFDLEDQLITKMENN